MLAASRTLQSTSDGLSFAQNKVIDCIEISNAWLSFLIEKNQSHLVDTYFLTKEEILNLPSAECAFLDRCKCIACSILYMAQFSDWYEGIDCSKQPTMYGTVVLKTVC